ncbi:MAG: CBS domain-containing protein [Mariprofundaceae bacterium]|nr:CBS domain-containing protein [Mariprofundaceae bacterium]
MIASNVMTMKPTTIPEDAKVKDAIVLFKSTQLHDLPVTDSENRPIGSISTRAILHVAVPAYADNKLLAAMKGGPDIESVYNNLKNISEKPVAKIMDQHVHLIPGDTPTSAVAAMLTNLHHDTFNILVVDNEGRLIGTISARDIVCRTAE